MAGDLMQSIREHLEFLDYEIKPNEDWIRATHPDKVNLSFRKFAGGVLFQAIFGCKDRAKSDRAEYLDVINSLNAKARIVRIYADEDADFLIEAWYPDNYERQSFGLFMELWDRDVLLIFEVNLEEFLL